MVHRSFRVVATQLRRSAGWGTAAMRAATLTLYALSLVSCGIAILGVSGLISPVRAMTLISEEEARRPVGEVTPELGLRGITRGPSIKIVSPSGVTTTSPVVLRIVFEAHGGSAINVAAVKVTYLKSPSVDLTQRLRPYITADGIAVDQADVPAGRHAVRIDVRDAEGRQSSSVLNFTVDR